MTISSLTGRGGGGGEFAPARCASTVDVTISSQSASCCPYVGGLFFVDGISHIDGRMQRAQAVHGGGGAWVCRTLMIGPDIIVMGTGGEPWRGRRESRSRAVAGCCKTNHAWERGGCCPGCYGRKVVRRMAEYLYDQNVGSQALGHVCAIFSAYRQPQCWATLRTRRMKPRALPTFIS